MTVPKGAIPVIVPPFEPAAFEPGALARAGLELPIPLEAVHFALPKAIEEGFGSLWKTCPVVGLDLPIEAAREAWFRKYSAVDTFVSPSSIGVQVSPEALSQTAWWILVQGNAEAVPSFLLDVSFRLDVTGADNELNVRFAELISRRWKVGVGLVNAARVGRVWMNPRCLRWIVRELAAALAAARHGSPAALRLGVEAQLFANMFFGHVVEGGTVDHADVLAACWLLHEQFHGMSERQGIGDPFDPLSAMSALGFSTPGRLRMIERLATWSAIWRMPDDHRSAAQNRWNGTPPSALRAAFEESTGISVHRWLGLTLAVALPRWVEADERSLRSSPLSRSSLTALCAGDATAAQHLAALMVAELGTTFEQLGDTVLAANPAYTGFGSTSQTEASALHERPLVEFSDGSWSISSPEAYAARAVGVPRTVIERTNKMGDRRRLGGVIGRMFEAHGWDVLDRLNQSHLVVTGDRIDELAGGGARGDAIVAKSDCAIVFEFGLQPTGPDAARGDRGEVLDVLKRYVDKLRQAADTPHHVFAHLIPTISALRVGRVVVADEPLPISVVHVASMREMGSNLPDMFVISIDELESLVDLAEMPVSVPDALLAWLTGVRKCPFAHHIAELERLVPRSRARLNAALEQLYRDATATPPAGKAA